MWLVNANVLDVSTGEALPGRSVRIDAGGLIAEVGSSAPAGLADREVLDLGGRWLLPGIISCHTHLSVVFPFSETDEAEDPAVTAFRAATRAHEALLAGVTTIRCVHEQNQIDLRLRRAAARGWFRAPRIRGAGRAITVPGGHGAGSACVTASGEEAFFTAAAAELADGADHIKIFINGGLANAGEHYEDAEMTDGEIRGAVRAAHGHDSYVVAHSGESGAIRAALAQGVTSFEHAYRLDEETARLLARDGVFLTPTLCVTRSEGWMRAKGFEEHSITNALAAAEDHLTSIKRAIRAGVTLVNGTDYPPGDPVDGTPAALYELMLMRQAGLAPLAALQSVSLNAARLLRIGESVGQVRPGFVADLVAVAHNPLEEFETMRDISFVMQAGAVLRDAA